MNVPLSEQDTDAPNFFVPMVDMLAGVIFILVILLVSVALVARDDFSVTEEAQREVARVEAELKTARATETTYLQPRRQAREAAATLLTRLQQHLSQAGVRAEIEQQISALRFDLTDFFGTGLSLTERGSSATHALAEGLVRYLPCVGIVAPSTEACVGFPSARLARMVVAVHGPSSVGMKAEDAKIATDAQSLDLYATLVRLQPALVALKNSSGQPLLGYSGFGLSAPVVDATRNVTANSGRVDLLFEMDVPPLPAAQ